MNVLPDLEDPASLIGLTVTQVRRVTEKDLGPDWGDFVGETALELSDGTLLFAACDTEANRPGAFYRASSQTITPCVLVEQ